MKKLLDRLKARKNNILKLLLCVGGFLFAVLIFAPCDAYLNNAKEFAFPISDFVFSLLIKLVISLAVLTVLGLLLNEKIVNIVSCLFCGLSLCVYAQCLFMNSNLPSFMGEAVDWDSFQGFSIITLFVWIALLALPFVLWFVIKKKREFILKLASGFIAAVQLVSVIITAATTTENITSYKRFGLDGTEQYTVSSQKNIVTFIFDATDNIYFNEILSDSPEAFDGLEDFTLYTNTCSVFDFTDVSLTQMYTGDNGFHTPSPISSAQWTVEAWISDKTQQFYDRLRDANYTVNGYLSCNLTMGLLFDKFDNANQELKPILVDKQSIEKGMLEIAAYKWAPFLFKKFINAADIDFDSFVKYPTYYYCDNNAFRENLKLSKSNSDKNYFIVEHLNGTHEPCDDMIGETKNCLNIVKEYIEQMKAMGVYDNSTIIVTSDHGRHEKEDFSAGANTPIFMIKEANKTQDKMQFNNAPISHADFMATYLKIAGLYTDEDKEIYGNTIYDFDENSKRERIHYLHKRDDNYPNYNNESYNVFYFYKYTGDSKDLQDLLQNGSPTEVYVKK